jgi:hypothetical protein
VCSSDLGKRVTVTNSGQIATEGEQATAIYAQAVGGGGGTGGKASTGFSGDISVGGWGGAAGDGGEVIVSNTGAIYTEGNLADGIFAQSVGGGGGDGGAADFGDARSARAEMIKALRKSKGDVKKALSDFAKKVFLPTVGVGVGGFGGAAGDGGAVMVCNGATFDAASGTCTGSVTTATISTLGNASHGIFAQSVGGGGGIVGNTIEVTEAEVDTDLNFDGDKDDTFDISDGTAFAGTVGGKGKGGVVNVTHTGSIYAPSLNGIGIFAQSVGGDGGSTVTVNVDGGTIQGGELYDDGTGLAAAIIIDGGDADNTLTIGADSLVYAVDEQVLLGGDETETVYSSGKVIGNIDLDYHATAANSNDYFNLAGGILETRTKINLAAGLLQNAGTLDIGGFGVVTTTTLNGNFEQTDSGNILGDFSFGVAASDLLEHNGTTTVDGLVTPNLITLARLAPPETFIRGGVAVVDNGMDAVDTLTVDYGVVIDDVEVQLGINGIDFTPDSADLTRNQEAGGNFINTILRGDGSEALGTLFAYLGNLKVGEEDELARVLQRIHPEAYASKLAPTLFTAERFGNLLQSCPVNGDTGAIIREGQCLWARVSGGIFDKDPTFDYSRVREETYAFSSGVQFVLAPTWRFGLAAEYEQTDVDVGDLANSNGDRFQFGGILKYQEGNFLLSGAASGGYGWYDTTRYVNLTSVVPYADTAYANDDISHAHLQLRAAQLFHAGAFYAKPLVDVSATFLRTHSFSETGAGALNLEVQGTGEWVFAATPSLELGAQFTDAASGIQFRPYVRLGVTHYSESTLGVDATWQGAPASAGTFTALSDLDQTVGNITAGLDIVDPDDRFDVRMSYDGRFGDDNIQSHAGTVRAGIHY